MRSNKLEFCTSSISLPPPSVGSESSRPEEEKESRRSEGVERSVPINSLLSISKHISNEDGLDGSDDDSSDGGASHLLVNDTTGGSGRHHYFGGGSHSSGTSTTATMGSSPPEGSTSGKEGGAARDKPQPGGAGGASLVRQQLFAHMRSRQAEASSGGGNGFLALQDPQNISSSSSAQYLMTGSANGTLTSHTNSSASFGGLSILSNTSQNQSQSFQSGNSLEAPHAHSRMMTVPPPPLHQPQNYQPPQGLPAFESISTKTISHHPNSNNTTQPATPTSKTCGGEKDDMSASGIIGKHPSSQHDEEGSESLSSLHTSITSHVTVNSVVMHQSVRTPATSVVDLELSLGSSGTVMVGHHLGRSTPTGSSGGGPMMVVRSSSLNGGANSNNSSIGCLSSSSPRSTGSGGGAHRGADPLSCVSGSFSDDGSDEEGDDDRDGAAPFAFGRVKQQGGAEASPLIVRHQSQDGADSVSDSDEDYHLPTSQQEVVQGRWRVGHTAQRSAASCHQVKKINKSSGGEGGADEDENYDEREEVRRSVELPLPFPNNRRAVGSRSKSPSRSPSKDPMQWSVSQDVHVSQQRDEMEDEEANEWEAKTNQTPMRLSPPIQRGRPPRQSSQANNMRASASPSSAITSLWSVTTVNTSVFVDDHSNPEDGDHLGSHVTTSSGTLSQVPITAPTPVMCESAENSLQSPPPGVILQPQYDYTPSTPPLRSQLTSTSSLGSPGGENGGGRKGNVVRGGVGGGMSSLSCSSSDKQDLRRGSSFVRFLLPEDVTPITAEEKEEEIQKAQRLRASLAASTRQAVLPVQSNNNRK